MPTLTRRRPISRLNPVEVSDAIAGFYGQSQLSLALDDFVRYVGGDNGLWALAGGLAVGFYGQPRATQDVDIILWSENTIELVAELTTRCFRRKRKHALLHIKTGVEIELLTAKHLGVPLVVIQTAITTARHLDYHNHLLPVVSAAGLVALKLQRGSLQDLADIKRVLEKVHNLDLRDFGLSAEHKRLLAEIREIP